MRPIAIALIVLLAAALINFIRGSECFPLPRVLPMCDGRSFSMQYALGGIALILLLIWGLRRLGPGGGPKPDAAVRDDQDLIDEDYSDEPESHSQDEEE